MVYDCFAQCNVYCVGIRPRLDKPCVLLIAFPLAIKKWQFRQFRFSQFNYRPTQNRALFRYA